MELFEYESKAIFASNGISVPKGIVATSLQEALAAFKSIGKEVVIKPIGIKGRGKAGAVSFAKDEDGVSEAVGRLLGSTIKGKAIKELIIEERLKVDRELYAAITVDFSSAAPILILSASGGVDIEEVARANPELIIREQIDITKGLDADAVGSALARLGIRDGTPMLDALQGMYRIFRSYDAETVEINPLVESGGRLVALDALIVINDDSLKRHPELEQKFEERKYSTEIERAMGKLGWSYTDLDGDIGIICSGAGLTMATLDMIQLQGGRPGNFLDMAQVDGDGIYKALELMSKKKGNRAIMINLVAGLNRCDSMADGLKRFVNEHGLAVPIIVRMVGNMQDEGERVIADAGLKNVPSLEDAVKNATEAAAKR